MKLVGGITAGHGVSASSAPDRTTRPQLVPSPGFGPIIVKLQGDPARWYRFAVDPSLTALRPHGVADVPPPVFIPRNAAKAAKRKCRAAAAVMEVAASLRLAASGCGGRAADEIHRSVALPSHRRMLRCYEAMLRGPQLPPRRYLLHALTLSRPPRHRSAGCAPRVVVSTLREETEEWLPAFDSSLGGGTFGSVCGEGSVTVPLRETLVDGEVRIRVLGTTGDEAELLLSFWFHTAFHHGPCLSLPLAELDETLHTSAYGRPGTFFVTLTFSPLASVGEPLRSRDDDSG